MLERSIPDTFDPATVSAIDARLAGIRASEGVHIPLAIESGSRAWGFPSPDSDYDCRFVYVRTAEQLITPWPWRDVIETPLEGDLDVNGWDLAKALKLMLKGNAVIIEWLRSPIAYGIEAQFREGFLALAERAVAPTLIIRHYLHLGLRQRRVDFGGDKVKIKRLFYTLRPAAALRWMRLHPGRAIVPMHFPTLMAECEPPAGLAAIVDELLARKAVTRELGSSRVPAEVLAFIDAEFERIQDSTDLSSVRVSDEIREEAVAFFRETTRRLDAGA